MSGIRKHILSKSALDKPQGTKLFKTFLIEQV